MGEEGTASKDLESSSEIRKTSENNSIDKELDRIRLRRTDKNKKFPKTFDDVVLIFGLIAGIVFFGGVTLLSSGMLAGDSIILDENLSKTPLDTGGECVDNQGAVSFSIFIENHDDIKIRSKNVLSDKSSVIVVKITNYSDSEPYFEFYKSGIGNLDFSFELEDGVNDGHYALSAQIYQGSDDSELTVTNKSTFEEFSSELQKNGDEKIVDLEVHGHSLVISDPEPRDCFTMTEFGYWGWALMAAEWAGGRETAMLTGGSAGVPAWWMASISLGMSIFFLCVQYPLMHRMYHREIDDILTKKQLFRLIQRTLVKSEGNLRISINFDELKMQERAISIDIIIPYLSTKKTIGEATDIRARLTKDLLEEFSIFGEMRPLQIKSICLDGKNNTSNNEFILSSDLSLIISDRSPLSEDYSSFFSGLGANGRLEEEIIHTLDRWFRKHNLLDYGSAIIVDEESVLIRVIYTPMMKFSYFLYRKSFIDMQDDLTDFLIMNLEGLLGDRELIVSARNEKATLSDRAVAGRVELGSNQDDLVGEAMVAKQAGITGVLLQNPFMGDILSSVEYVAHSNRSRIDKYGFWGLIVFVWIPFMASGVLVGAMLGLVARMRFRRVLLACLIGGSAASITWAYTARGIIEFMEKYHAQTFIPFLIFLAFVFTFLHLRRNKRRRREELFRESMKFFSGVSTG
ncbi:MAG: hypothetical protein CL426_00010 [Acidimicrobiaceae bacterium]|nr:hypothetical protein [Acidimicrobiaceae bacterium]|tara:strand:+ start:666 stop:2723 length:2058 start_codon:yes stop_codon:yes gene_type:complete